MAPGVTNIRRECGRIKRTIRMRVLAGIAHQDEAAVVSVSISLDELVVEPCMLLQSVNIEVAIGKMKFLNQNRRILEKEKKFVRKYIQ